MTTTKFIPSPRADVPSERRQARVQAGPIRPAEWDRYFALCTLTAQALCHGLQCWSQLDRDAELLGQRLRRREPATWLVRRQAVLDAEFRGYHCPGPDQASICDFCAYGLYEPAGAS